MDETQETHDRIAKRLRHNFAMIEDGYAMKRQQFRRRFPQADEAEVERRFREWLRDRPGAEFGDGVGSPGRWPRVLP